MMLKKNPISRAISVVTQTQKLSSKLIAYCSPLVLALATLPLQAQESKEKESSLLLMEEVVVTGTASSARTKFESSVAITTADADAIKQINPLTTADLFAAVPGLWVESSAGDSNANVFARGIPQDGGYFYINLQEDGIPVFPTSALSFFGADMLIRLDESVERMEVVRGGTSPIFAPSAPGGIVNFVTKKGTEEPEGLMKFTLGDYDMYRGDYFYSGPFSDDWLIAIGGFFRSSDGIRDPEFRSDRGGQVRVSLTREIEKGELELFGRVMDDRTQFLTGLPMQDAKDPRGVPGFDAGQGTLHSNDLRRAPLTAAAEMGLSNNDLADGIHSELTTFGARLDLEVSDNIRISNKFRFTDADVLFTSVFTADEAMTGTEFAAAGRTDTINEGEPDEEDIVIRAPIDNPGFTYVDDGTTFDPDQLIMDAQIWAVKKNLESFANDFRINFTTENNDLTIGVYFADYSSDDKWSLGHGFLMEASDNARRLVLENLDDGSLATSPGGQTNLSTFNLDASHEATSLAIYISNEWDVTDDFRLDFGVRWQEDEIDSSISNTENGIDFDGDEDTTFDNNTTQTDGTFRTVEEDLEDVAWSIGFNYNLTSEMGFFGHYTDSFRIPNFDDLRDGKDEVEDITQIELGYKLSQDDFSLFATAFQSEFDNVFFNDVLADGSTRQAFAETETYGIELEVVWVPIEQLNLSASFTWQEPEYSSFVKVDESEDPPVITDNTDNQIRRIPETMFRFTPTYYFNDKGRIYLTYTFIDDRFGDDENTQDLVDFDTIDIGFIYEFTDKLSIQFVGNNITDEVGLTEGNIRLATAGETGATFFNARPIFGESYRASLTVKF